AAHGAGAGVVAHHGGRADAGAVVAHAAAHEALRVATDGGAGRRRGAGGCHCARRFRARTAVHAGAAEGDAASVRSTQGSGAAIHGGAATHRGATVYRGATVRGAAADRGTAVRGAANAHAAFA